LIEKANQVLKMPSLYKETTTLSAIKQQQQHAVSACEMILTGGNLFPDNKKTTW
jgi:hypothetical protein